jgi:TolB protein
MVLTIACFFLCCGNSGTASGTSTNVAPSKEENDSSIRPTGTIAYIRNATEIRLIDSNGHNDHRLWTDPEIKESLGLYDVAWRPDGKELAFSSAHEALFSLYHADIYTIRPDGSGYRKITNAPSKKEFAKFKKGSVVLTVRNNQYTFQQANSSSGVFFITIAGAEDPQMVTVAPGSSKTITFKSVADFGKKAQAIVAINGNYRWFMPGMDVEAGKTVKAPDLTITGDGIEYFGAFRPVWKQDGSQISYRDGVCLIKTISAHPTEGELQYKSIFKDKNPMGTCNWDYGPTPALADQIIYTENSGEGSNIYIMKERGVHDPLTKLTQYSDIQYQILHDLKWLPDGSGFLYSTVNLFRDAANIFRYDIRTKQTRQLTQLQGVFARKFCISPSGNWIVYERAKTNDEDKDVDLWIMKIDGTGEKLLVKNGLCPSWSK